MAYSGLKYMCGGRMGKNGNVLIRCDYDITDKVEALPHDGIKHVITCPVCGRDNVFLNPVPNKE